MRYQKRYHIFGVRNVPLVTRTAGTHVRRGSKTVLTPSKWDVCFTPESRHRSCYAADCDVIACYGGTKLVDKRQIFGWLKRREQHRHVRRRSPGGKASPGDVILSVPSRGRYRK